MGEAGVTRVWKHTVKERILLVFPLPTPIPSLPLEPPWKPQGKEAQKLVPSDTKQNRSLEHDSECKQ